MLEDFIGVNGLKAKLFEVSSRVVSVKDVGEKVGIPSEDNAKSLLFITPENTPVLAVVLGHTRVDTKKLKSVLGIKDVRLAEPREVLEITGYEVGGVPPVSVYGVKTLLDKQVTKKDLVVCGGGDTMHLLKISPKEIIEHNEEISVEDIAKE